MNEIIKQYGETILVVAAEIMILGMFFIGWITNDPSNEKDAINYIRKNASPIVQKEIVEKNNEALIDKTKQTFGIVMIKQRTFYNTPVYLTDLIRIESNEQHFNDDGSVKETLLYNWNEHTKQFERSALVNGTLTLFTQKGIVEIESIKDQANNDVTESILKLDEYGERTFTFTQSGQYAIHFKITTQDKTIFHIVLNGAVDIQ